MINEVLTKEEVCNFIIEMTKAAMYSSSDDYEQLKLLYEAACEYDNNSCLKYLKDDGVFMVVPD